MSNPIKDYLKKIEKAFLAGNATEHTHRPALKDLLETLDQSITATNEPKREKCGAPDFIVTRGQTPLGYIETKDIGISLKEIEKSDQMRRYLSSLSNLILTDYLEFRWYVGGEHRLTVRIAEEGPNRLRVDKDGVDRILALITQFLTVQVPTVSNAKELAQRMAALARLIREAIQKALKAADGGGSLRYQMKGFQEVLLHDLTDAQFADMYAQTICYGLFAARCNSDLSARFTRKDAAYDLPKTNPFLRKMFSHLAGPDLDDRVVWVVDDLAELLHHCDMTSILQDFGNRPRQKDPVIHFYETFLSAYDPEMRVLRGVYYTPPPVVSYIVKSVDQILKKDFGLQEGLADASTVTMETSAEKKRAEFHKVQILDPACGTGTFLHSVVNRIYESFEKNKGMWSGYVSEHLLPRLWGFELLMAPYAVAHMKLGLQLAQTGYDFMSDERLGVYLTNSLEEAFFTSTEHLFAEWLVEEANEAGSVKKDFPIMVVLGNPPYFGKSANRSKVDVPVQKGRPYIKAYQYRIDTDAYGVVRAKWYPVFGKATGDKMVSQKTFIGTLIMDYQLVDNQPLRERNPKWLQNDYVKFLRFGQWRIDRTGSGILAFVTSHSYLGNPTFRGMRQSLMNSFSEIYVLDLHGGSQKTELSPEGSKDENVFQIRQGVAISIFVKRSGSNRPAKVYHSELWGLKEIFKNTELVGGKYKWLENNAVSSTDWNLLNPRSPYYLFVPQKNTLQTEYDAGWKITDAMPLYGVGMTTARDHFVVDFMPQPILDRMKEFGQSDKSNSDLCQELAIPEKKGWKISAARQAIGNETDLKQYIRTVLYRPFDSRYIFYHDAVVWRTVKKMMSHMISGDNIGLCTTRSVEIGRGWEHVFCTTQIMQHHSVSLKEVNYLFPLYRYDDQSVNDSLFPREVNFAQAFISDICSHTGLVFAGEGMADMETSVGAENIFHYIYAVFYSSTYRRRYAELLRNDFPRVPLTSNLALFRCMCSFGRALVQIHLQKEEGLRISDYPEDGNNIVERVHYTESGHGDGEGRVWINETQYFKGVSPEVWGVHIGGYHVCEKWLKDRNGRKLSFDDLTQYQKIVSALSETIRIMHEIDTLIEEHGGFPL